MPETALLRLFAGQPPVTGQASIMEVVLRKICTMKKGFKTEVLKPLGTADVNKTT